MIEKSAPSLSVSRSIASDHHRQTLSIAATTSWRRWSAVKLAGASSRQKYRSRGYRHGPLLKLAEEPTEVGCEHIRDFVCSVVATLIIGVPLHDVPVIAFGKAADRPKIVGEARQTDRDGGRLARVL